MNETLHSRTDQRVLSDPADTDASFSRLWLRRAQVPDVLDRDVLALPGLHRHNARTVTDEDRNSR